MKPETTNLLARSGHGLRFPLVDCNVCVGPWPFRPLRRSQPGRLCSHLAHLGVDRVVATSNASVFFLNPADGDRLILRRPPALAERLAPVATINPSLPQWEADLERALERGARGIRLLPRYHAYELKAEYVRDLVALAAQHRLPLVLPLRLEDERHQHPLCIVTPLQVEDILRWYDSLPTRPALLLQNGRFSEWKTVGSQIGDGEPVYLDLSFVNGPDGAIEELVELVGPERLLFGTRSPFQYALPKIEQLAAALIPESAREAIGQGNAVRLFFRM